jgi:hypothetical protein
MEGQEQNNTNMGMGGANMGGASPSKSSVGPIIGIIILLAIVILGGLYFWGERSVEEVESDPAADAAVESINTQSTSDDVNSIEADLDATEIENLDAEINAS